MAGVYRADDDIARAAVVWIHGGALIMGHREGISDRIKKMSADHGSALVTLDYRLAPEAKLPEIIADIEDAFTWIHTDGPARFDADRVC